MIVFKILLLVCSAAAPSAEARPRPEWIWSGEVRHAGATACFRSTFQLHQKVLRARCRGAADFNTMTVLLNGRPVAMVEDYGPQRTIDVTANVRRGENVVAVRSEGSEGPTAIAVELHLLFEDQTERTIVSDDTWLTTPDAQEGWTAKEFSTNGWTHAVSYGRVAEEMWGRKSDVVIQELDDYTQWKRALGTDAVTIPAAFVALPGFEVELIRAARPDEGSWISMAFDPRGRLTVAKEEKGLLRLSIPEDLRDRIQVETINDTLKECRGLLYAAGSLYVNANESKALYRLRDTDGDDRFDEEKLLYRSGGSTGHGRNDLALGPDGMIYSIHGDAVDLPQGFEDRTSPFRESRRGVKTREGHLIRTDPEGKHWELIAGGLRNPYGIDFNADGEPFTYDADAEYDAGSSWYRPTRVHHLLKGADYGWRGVTRAWPPYFPDHPDAAPPNLDIGKGSPTGVKFGTKSRFPPAFRNALFVLDWAYGRIIAVHTTPRGASYAFRPEVFLRGRPLNVTDLDFGPDGAMYFVTGGRKTQSGLYRVRYVGDSVDEAAPTPQQSARAQHAGNVRSLRRLLESFHGSVDARAVETAWPHLNSPDPWLRHAARIAVEHQPVSRWQELALSERRPTAALTALMSLAQGGPVVSVPAILARLEQLSFGGMSTGQKLIALRVCELCLSRRGNAEDVIPPRLKHALETLYPDESWIVNQELSKLLVALEAPDFVEKSLDLLEKSTQQREQLHYLFVLRNAKRGWTPDTRKQYFRSLAMMDVFQGGEGMPTFTRLIESDAVASLGAAERKSLDPLIAALEKKQSGSTTVLVERPFVKEWTHADFAGKLSAVRGDRDIERGKEMFAAALCIRCHRMGNKGTAIGPELTSVANRFSPSDVLESILTPSKVVAEQYRNVTVITKSGEIFNGRIVAHNDYRSPMLRIATDPLAPEKFIEVAKSEIEKSEPVHVSSMPKGLLNTLNQDEILDLLAYIESGGRLADGRK